MKMETWIDPPAMNNTKTYEQYKQEIIAWSLVTDYIKEKQGIVIALSLPEDDEYKIREKVFDQVCLNDLKGENGLNNLVKFLDKHLAKDDLTDSLDKFNEFETFKRVEDCVYSVTKCIDNISEKLWIPRRTIMNVGVEKHAMCISANGYTVEIEKKTLRVGKKANINKMRWKRRKKRNNGTKRTTRKKIWSKRARMWKRKKIWTKRRKMWKRKKLWTKRNTMWKKRMKGKKIWTKRIKMWKRMKMWKKRMKMWSKRARMWKRKKIWTKRRKMWKRKKLWTKRNTMWKKRMKGKKIWTKRIKMWKRMKMLKKRTKRNKMWKKRKKKKKIRMKRKAMMKKKKLELTCFIFVMGQNNPQV